MSLNLLNNYNISLLKQLDWDVILGQIKGEAYFENSYQELSRPIYDKSINEINESLNTLKDIQKIIKGNNHLQILNIFKKLDSSHLLSDSISKLSKNAVLSVLQLHDLAKDIEAYNGLFKHLRKSEYFKKYNYFGDNLNIVRRKFVDPLRIFVSSDGQIDYLKHPELSSHYEKLHKIEEEIRRQLKSLIRSNKFEKIIRFDEYDIINDHYVLAIRSDSYHSTYGQIISHSDSGLTLYIEPFSIKKKCNERIMILAKIDEVLFSICKDLSFVIAPYHYLFKKIRDFYYVLDILLAKGIYCYKNNFVYPTINVNSQTEIVGIFHPLVLDCIKNDIRITDSCKGLIISGPNTGGKTVMLKSLALVHLFIHFGLFVPADSAVIHPFKAIFFFGNDQQSLAMGLSSFSSEVKNYLSIFDDLVESNLIIIDEIFNTTSSEEASALAMAVFAEIHLRSNSKLIVSTHHQSLKTMIHEKKEYISSHVGFNILEERPTYKIIEGIPGSSMALTIFKSWGLKFNNMSQIVIRAREILDDKSLSYEKLLEEISLKNESLKKMILENKKINQELKHKKQAIDGDLHFKMQQKLKNFENTFENILIKANQLVHKIKNEKSFTKQIDKIKSEFYVLKEEVSGPTIHENISNIVPKKLVKGQKYFSTSLNKKVQITNYDNKKDEVVIKIGAMTVYEPRKKLRELISKEKVVDSKVHVEYIKSEKENMSCHIDCHGLRLDEFKNKIDHLLDQLILEEYPYLIIIHGHGDGVLKSWLRNYLKDSKMFVCEIPDRSQDSHTKISLSK